jgi:hypothetical protein
MWQSVEGAGGAAGVGFAVVLAGHDQQGVELVEQGCVGFEIRLEQVLQLVIVKSLRGQQVRRRAEVRCEYPEMDFNQDWKVDQADLDIFMQHWLECSLDDPNACWPQGPPLTPHVQP